MLRIDFGPDDQLSVSGFTMGHLRIVGEYGRHGFHCMVVLSATMLMDQILEWVKRAAVPLEFNPADQGDLLIFAREKDEVTISVRTHSGKLGIGRLEIHALLDELLRACGELQDFVSRLPVEDAGRYDFEASASDFRKFVEKL